jgi:hypothetical protein
MVKKNYNNSLEQPDDREIVPTVAAGEAGESSGLVSSGTAPKSNPPQPDQDIEELNKIIGSDMQEVQATQRWWEVAPLTTRKVLAKLRTLGWEKRGGEAAQTITEIVVKVYDMATGATGRTGHEEYVVRKNTLEWAISEIRAIERDAVERVKSEIKSLDIYVQQVVKENNGVWCGNVLIDPVALAALSYWWQALKSELLGEQDKGG